MVKAAIRKSVSPSAVHKVRKMDEEQLEMRLYLSKLRQLVPNMPKNRKVSKVEVINNVIDYICDLQSALIDQLHASPSAAAAVATIISNNNSVEVVDANPARAVSC